MVILCGVDGSAPSLEAARAAAALAQRAGEALQLVYVQDAFLVDFAGPGGAPVPLANQQLLDADRRHMQAELEPQAAALAREFQIEAGFCIEVGFPDRELARCAQELQASFVVVGAVGRRKGSPWRLGSVADRLSQTAPAPLLIVRESKSLERWAEGHPLAVAVALGFESSSAAALRATLELQRLGPCEVTEVHAYDPGREARRLGLAATTGPETRRVIENTLARELAQRFAERSGEARFVALPAETHVVETLAEFGESARVELFVAGTRGRGALRRRFLGSVSYGLVGLAVGNVLIAPGPRPAAKTPGPRTPAVVRRALVATDFSEAGNCALDLALAVLPEGGELVLLHVLPVALSVRQPLPGLLRQSAEERRLDRSLAEAELRKLLPSEGRTQEVHVEALESEDVPRAILQAAERHGVDLVILGRHGHGRVSDALLGSVASAVAQRSPRPVLLVPEPVATG